MKRWQNLSKTTIILGSTFGLALATFLFLQAGSLLLRQTNIAQLPPLPEKPATLLGASLPEWFLAEPVVLTEEGNQYTYRYNIEAENNIWQLAPEVEVDSEDKCTPAEERKIARAAGTIVECRRSYMFGEWCPAPVALHALTAEGEVWEYVQDRPCTWMHTLTSVVFGAGGFILGTFIVIVRHFWRKRRQNNSHLESTP